ncbi:hypothetical protein TOPH_07501 [Tolypocladium ophioglossoides CBS 100239]|uniref:Uncharacterized protein n=1 Tax=Tolypocladium ophioglossoides (strain CBS 100239) TaxID=1163406 RepID=A0A0L0N165_TOLOC|nr:hypothetical protein TOPH_07501 [Tolypocladium ophioglossoides CBS 100239]
MTINYTGLIAASTCDCTSLHNDGTKLITEFSIVYTSTVTFYGNRGDYTPPFETLVTPNYCTPTVIPSVLTDVTPKIFTSDLLLAPSSRKSKYRLALPFRPVITFITTDKNPSVVFPSAPVPAYTPAGGLDGPGGDPDNGNHKTADSSGSPGGNPGRGSSGEGSSGDPGGSPTPDAESIGKGPQPIFKVTARGTQVIINDKTFPGLGLGQTSVVTVGGGTFTIYPTAIVGEGATVQKPAPVGTVVSIATPTTGIVGGLPVTLTGSEAIVGGTTVAIPEGGTTAVVSGQRVSIGPGTLVVAEETLSFDPVMPSRETDVLVSGGELLTAIGSSVVVIHSTTFTYGPGIPGMTEVVNGETISIGPSGVMVHGMVMGGPSADTSATSYEIVGGVTISRIAPSVAVINGVTFTVGPGTRWTTTAIAGETFTIGPAGVIVSTTTLGYPFGSAVTATIAPTGTWLNDFPVETAAHHDTDDDNGGTFLRPDICVRWIALCIAIGVLALG